MDEQAQTTEELPVSEPKEANIELQKQELTDEQKKQQEIQELKAKRAQECREKFNTLLAEYNCYTDISLTISTNGRISGTISILAK